MNIDLSIISLIFNAGIIVQAVMLLLLTGSVFSWAIIFSRKQLFERAEKQLTVFEMRFGQSLDFDKLLDHLSVKRDQIFGIENVYRIALREFLRIRKQVGDKPAVIIEGTERAIRGALIREEQTLEHQLPFLATVGSISVYIGLLGTVIGIMNAMRALGMAQQASLAMVAPGISEALIATAIGLFTAIPAAYAYNRFSNRLQILLQSYEALAEDLVGLLQRRLYSDSAEIQTGVYK